SGGRDKYSYQHSGAHLGNRDAFVRRDRAAVVVDPGEAEGAALLDPDGELKIRIGGDRGLEVARERERAVELAGKTVDDLARHERAGFVLAQAGFHRMPEQGLDLDDLAFFRLSRNFDPRFISHRTLRSSLSPPCGL